MDENIQITQRRRVQGTFVWIFLLTETKQKICFQVEFVICVLKGLDIPRKNEPLLRWAEKGVVWVLVPAFLGFRKPGRSWQLYQGRLRWPRADVPDGHTHDTSGKDKCL